MAERNYRRYTEAFKLEALALLRQGHKRAGQIERELGITPGLLLKWRARYQAVWQRHPSAALLHHSDQGTQYTSDAYQQGLAAHHCQVSMSRIGNCFDNAAMESFFSTLKTECANTQFTTRAQARTTKLRVHRSLVQSSPFALLTRLPQPGGVRTQFPALIVSTKTGQVHKEQRGRRTEMGEEINFSFIRNYNFINTLRCSPPPFVHAEWGRYGRGSVFIPYKTILFT